MSNPGPHNSRLIQPAVVPWLILLLGVPLTYAIIRYHVLQGVEASQFPLYVTNKAFALAAVFFIAASYLIGKTSKILEGDDGRRLILIRFCGLTGFSLAAIHALMGLVMVSPHYYPGFFSEGGRMNLTGELSLLLGVLSLWCFSITAITSLPFMYEALGADRWCHGQQMGYLALTLVAGHVAVMGFSGWLNVAGWAGYLPPISLVAFVAALIPPLVKLRGNHSARQRLQHSADVTKIPLIVLEMGGSIQDSGGLDDDRANP